MDSSFGRLVVDMGQYQQKAAAVYGDVISATKRRKLLSDADGHPGCLAWYDNPELFEPGSAPSSVFVDLDDPQFAASDFLISLATGGEKIKIIGKANESDLDHALHFSKLGVAEILPPDQCLERLHELLEGLETDLKPKPKKGSQFSREAIVGDSPQTEEIIATMEVLSQVDFPSALILGETGTGKSLICKVLHNSGQRASHNLVEVNCSAIPDELFESELFGHIKGAFTGADSDKQGLFEYAQDGTLFLDEVGNLSATAQAKLLKILEDKKLRKVGAVTESDINVRVVAATNLNLTLAIASGKFREDLYYRLNLLTIEIPPLRERRQDIQCLVSHYLEFYAVMYAKSGIKISRSAAEAMTTYHWPGNVRELCNVIERAVLLCQTKTIKPQDIKLALKKGRLSIADRQQIIINVPPHGLTLADAEQQVTKQVLNLFDWNKSETAKFLGISRPRLRRIIEAGGLEQDRRQV
jgi:DNA-binding NtrC family response regulator